MAILFENYEYRFNIKGKIGYVPSSLGRQIGLEIKRLVEQKVSFPDYYFHMRPGGHVDAMHLHAKNFWFARADLQSFFHSVRRNRVSCVLRDIGVPRHVHYAKWSCVKDANSGSGYILPYGFVQSPILATLVLYKSCLGECLSKISKDITVSLYMDDICLSGPNKRVVRSCMDSLLGAIDQAGFVVNREKLRLPCRKIDIFNCDISHGRVEVSAERCKEFYSEERSEHSRIGFELYCKKVHLQDVE